jgi:serine/threonine protein kinase
MLERIGSPFRECFLAFDPLSGPGGDYFLIQSLPAGRATEQRLRVISRLKDDAFPRAVEWQRLGGRIHVALTWVDGISLADYLKHIRGGRRPQVDPGQAVRLVHGLANAVCQLHRRLQIAHGDIQPTNVIVTSQPSRLRLIDFGSAWTTDWTTRREEGDGHHRCYAAPELQDGSTRVVFSADQFSVSVLFFELLTLELPYGGLGGKAGRADLAARASDSLTPPSQISKTCRELPRSCRDSLDAIVLRGLALDPDQRYPNYSDWVGDLHELSARFRVISELPPVESALTRVIDWFVRPRSSRTHRKS